MKQQEIKYQEKQEKSTKKDKKKQEKSKNISNDSPKELFTELIPDEIDKKEKIPDEKENVGQNLFESMEKVESEVLEMEEIKDKVYGN